MRLKKTAILAAAIALHTAGAALAEQPPRIITVTGQGVVTGTPDLATLTLGVETRGATAAEALRDNSARLGAVLERLKSGGIEPRDLQTSGLSLGPRSEYDEATRSSRVVDYEARNVVTVRVRDLTRLGGILDQAVGDGANTFHGVSFGLADATAAEDAARLEAVKDARRKADALATAAGAKIGQVLSIDAARSVDQGGGMVASYRMAEAAPAPVEGGEVSTSVTVTVTWALTD